MLIRSGESGHPYLIFDLGRSICSSTTKCNVCNMIFIDSFYKVEEVPLYICFSGSFYYECLLNFVKVFFCIN